MLPGEDGLVPISEASREASSVYKADKTIRSTWGADHPIARHFINGYRNARGGSKGLSWRSQMPSLFSRTGRLPRACNLRQQTALNRI